MSPSSPSASSCFAMEGSARMSRSASGLGPGTFSRHSRLWRTNLTGGRTMQKSFACALAVAVGTVLVRGAASSADSPDKGHAELAKALAAVKVSLGSGLTTAGTAGKPISAKFEVEDGKLSLSVYTEKDGKFNEV